jgi:hypothetical protein
VRAPLALTVLLITTLGVPAAAAEGLCSSTASVAWETDTAELTVTAAVVHTPGCSDGEAVGLQLLLDDGSEVPEAGPLMGSVADERARFDLSESPVEILPITGVRVFLEVRGDEQYTWQITVDRRFFNPAGSEQIGLRDLTVLQVPDGNTYRVEGAPVRYRETSCGDLGHEPADVIAVGSGVFVNVTAGGRHIACFQQITASGPGTLSGVGGDTDRSDDTIDRVPGDRTAVVDEVVEGAPSAGRLAMTGNDLLLAAAVGLATVGVGLGLLWRRRA